MRRRWLCLALLLALAAAFPAAGAAETVGDFEVTVGAADTDYTFDAGTGVLTVKNGAAVTVTMAAGKATTSQRIEVEENATVTLSGVHIDTYGGSPALKVLGGSGTVTVVLADGTENSLQGSSGIEKGDDDGTLLITCASAHGGGHACTETCGQLHARSSDGAAIGSASGKNARNITINGGRIEAIGTGYGAGIGCGSGYNARCSAENITINGGVITSGGAGGAAGIGGGGYGGSVKGITINGGQITATSADRAAAIGGGNNGSAENITITNGTVNATGGVGIGGAGSNLPGTGRNIRITGGTVNATGTSDGGIGGGSGLDVTIEGGTVTAISTSGNSPGIGARDLASARVTITGGTVTAQAGDSTATAIKGTPDFEDYAHKTYGNADANTDSATLVEWTGNPAADWSVWHWVRIEPAPPDETATVTLVDWDGTETVQALKGQTFAQPETPARPGYRFDGWYEDEGGTRAWDFSEPIPASGRLTLYAKWTALEYTVTFSLDGDTRTVPPETVATDARIPAPREPTRPGYTLDGWYQRSDYSGPKWDFDTGLMPPRALTLYARWTANEYTVTFETGGGDAVPPVQVATDARVPEPDPAPTRAGYTFGGWYRDRDGTPGQEWDFADEPMPPNGLTLYAKWIAEEYTVTFDAGGGSPAPSEQRVHTGELVAAPDPQPVRPGYTLSGWYTADGKPWDFASDRMPPGGLTLYARWTQDLPAAPAAADGGSGAPHTGDTGAGPWLALLLGSGLGLAVLLAARRRRAGS